MTDPQQPPPAGSARLATVRGTRAAALVNLRRPVVYLLAALVLGLASLVPALSVDLSGAGPGTVTPAAASSSAAPAPAQPDCGRPKESLRPRDALPTAGAMPAGSTMANIQRRGRLIAGVDQGKYLLGYRDPQTGNITGSDIDVVRLIAGAIFGDPDRVQFVVRNIADRTKMIEEGQVDVVVNSFTVTCQRQKTVEFSSAYLAASQRVLVPVASGITEVEKLAGQRVCTSTGATNEAVLRDLPLKLDVVTRPGIPDCVVDMQQGRVAAVSSDDSILAGLAAQDPQTRVVGRALASTLYGVGMSPRQPDLVRFVNALLERSRADGTLAGIEQRWLGAQLKPLPPVPPARYRD